MRSRASYKGHPLHPALIPFPFAFLWGALAFNVAGRLLDRPALWTTGSHLAVAGVVAALVAAVPGIVDYRHTVPPNSTGRTRATKHALLNSSATLLFGLSWLLRDTPSSEPSALVLALQVLGAVLLGIGGWMGGTLVVRNQIGVDHRYADAGKWSEARVDAMPGVPVFVAREDELQANQMKLLHVRVDGGGERRIVLGRTESGYVAFEDRCTHRGASLADGALMCGTVQCPWHGSQFDTSTGAVKAGPAKERIRTYQVRTSDAKVMLVVGKT